MNKMLHADHYHVAEAVEKLENGEQVQVWDSHCAMRGITTDEKKERNIQSDVLEDAVCTIKKEHSKLSLRFHENIVEEDFVFDGRGTDPSELNGVLGIVTAQLNYRYNIYDWDFASLNANSVGYDGLCDFEFSYEALI